MLLPTLALNITVSAAAFPRFTSPFAFSVPSHWMLNVLNVLVLGLNASLSSSESILNSSYASSATSLSTKVIFLNSSPEVWLICILSACPAVSPAWLIAIVDASLILPLSSTLNCATDKLSP